jgi:hypothetical protein
MALQIKIVLGDASELLKSVTSWLPRGGIAKDGYPALLA